MFDKRGYIVIERAGADEEALMTAAIDSGADDFREDDDNWEVVSPPEQHHDVLGALQAAGAAPVTAEIARLPKNLVKVESPQLDAALRKLASAQTSSSRPMNVSTRR